MKLKIDVISVKRWIFFKFFVLVRLVLSFNYIFNRVFNEDRCNSGKGKYFTI